MTDDASGEALEAHYYDGRSARQHRVLLRVEGASLLITGDDFERAEPLAAIRIAERFGSGPRLFQFGDGAHCEIRDHARLSEMMRGTGLAPRPIERWQQSWRIAVLSLLGVAVVALIAWRYGLPVVARVLAERTPPGINALLGEETLAALDKGLLAASKLDPARQMEISEGFDALAFDAAGQVPKLVFRRGGALGANAFALPDGTVIILDELVALSDDNIGIYAVLAHEVGHLSHRHGLRTLLQGSIVAVTMTAWLGDVSTVLALLPTVLIQSQYSRSFEAEADDYAVRELARRGIPSAQLADMLEKLTKAHGIEPERGSLLDSHPAPAERIRKLRDSTR